MFHVKVEGPPKFDGVTPLYNEAGDESGRLVVSGDIAFITQKPECPWEMDKVVWREDFNSHFDLIEQTRELIAWPEVWEWDCIVPGGGNNGRRW